MTVLITSSVTPGVRGHISRWLTEASPGIYIGNLTARVSAHLWETIQKQSGSGTAIMITKNSTEQGWACQNTGTGRWEPVDFDGITLFRRKR